MIVGLQDGAFAGWDLGSNQLNYLPAHSGMNPAVSFLSKYETLMISGDMQGQVQVRSTGNYEPVLPPINLTT